MPVQPGWMQNRESFRRGVRRGILESLLWLGLWISSFVVAIRAAAIEPLPPDWLTGSYGIPFWVATVIIWVAGAVTGVFVPTARRVRVDGSVLEIERKRQRRTFALNAFAEAVFFERPASRPGNQRPRVPACLVYLVCPPFATISLGAIDGPIAEVLMAAVARAGGRVKVFSGGTLVLHRPLGRGSPIPNS